MKQVYSLLPVVFGYEPAIKIDEFFIAGLADKKIQLMNTIVGLVKAKDLQRKSFLEKKVTFRKEDSIAVERKAVHQV